MIRIQANGRWTPALIDTGSAYSVADKAFIEKLPGFTKDLEPGDAKTLIAADSALVPVTGKMNICLEIQGVTIWQEFLIVPNLNCDLILGVSFLKDAKSHHRLRCPMRESIQWNYKGKT
jgi:hypothetical protein